MLGINGLTCIFKGSASFKHVFPEIIFGVSNIPQNECPAGQGDAPSAPNTSFPIEMIVAWKSLLAFCLYAHMACVPGLLRPCCYAQAPF